MTEKCEEKMVIKMSDNLNELGRGYQVRNN